MAKYRKKPAVVDAVQLSWRNWSEICGFLGNIICEENPGEMNAKTCSNSCGEDGPYIKIHIPTLEGTHEALHGDWIIKGVAGEFYPCKPDIFKKTYEEVE